MMLANSAYIKMLSASNIIMMKDNGGSQTPVAGMLTGSYIPQELGGNAQGTTSNSNGIRIFAGTVQNGNFANTAFTVDEEGTVRAGKGKILLNQDGSGRLADGNITWDADGNLIARQLTVDATSFDAFGYNTSNRNYDHIFIDQVHINPIGQLSFRFRIIKGGLIIGESWATMVFPSYDQVVAKAMRYGVTKEYGFLYTLLEQVKYDGGFANRFTSAELNTRYNVYVRPDFVVYGSHTGSFTFGDTNASSYGSSALSHIPGFVYSKNQDTFSPLLSTYVYLKDIDRLDHLTSISFVLPGSQPQQYYTLDEIQVPTPAIPSNYAIPEGTTTAPVSS
jgi:hypothetical protein